MIVKNKNRKTTLAKNLKIASSPIDNFLGLLKKSNPRSLLFKTRLGIHTFFLKEPIDVIVLNSKDLVKKAVTVRTNKLFLYSPKNSKILELPHGTIMNSKTQVGDELTFS